MCDVKHMQGLRGYATRLLLRVPGGVLLLFSVIACTANLPPKSGTTVNERIDGNYEERLQALETAMQQFAQQLDTLQAAAGNTRSTGGLADNRPAERRPIRPAIVLASNPVRRAPVKPVTPVHVPVTVPGVVPETAPPGVPVTPAHRPGQGDWVINLASYKNRSYATRKQAEFVEEGVAVEQVQAQVNGKTVYRLCVPGFVSSRAANAEATAIRAKLGLSTSWIARR